MRRVRGIFPYRDLHKKITNHYISLGDSPTSASSLAQQELLWLSQHAATTTTTLSSMVDQLVNHNKPLAYIIGNHPFAPIPIPILVRPPTLIPRPETEFWLSQLSSLLTPFLPLPNSTKYSVLDIGTGSGCLALGLAHYLPPPALITAIDISTSALALANENLARCPPPIGNNVVITNANLFSTVDDLESTFGGQNLFDLIVSNPPYIPSSDYESLPKGVKEWEDRLALVGETPANLEGGLVDQKLGLVFYRRIAQLLPHLLRRDEKIVQSKRPRVAVEVGIGQDGAVMDLFREVGLDATVIVDQWGIGRCVIGSS